MHSRFHIPESGLAAAVAVIGLVVAGCGSSSSSSNTASSPATTAASSSGAASGGYSSGYSRTTGSTQTTASTAAGGGTTLSLSADPSGALKFDKSTLTAKAGKITIAMKDPSSSALPHGIAISGNGVSQSGSTVQPGGTATVTATLKPGTYQFYCPVPGHKAGGMVGTLVVK